MGHPSNTLYTPTCFHRNVYNICNICNDIRNIYINNALTLTIYFLFTILRIIYYKPSPPLAVLINKKSSLLKA